MHTQERASFSILTWSRLIGAATLALALVLAATMGTQAAPLPPTCADFEELVLATEYHVGDTFSNDGLDFTVRPLANPPNPPITGGFVKVDNGGKAGGSGQDLLVNNANVEVVLTDPVSVITVRAGEYGGFVNLMVNGDLRKDDDLTAFHGLVIGGASVQVANPSANLYQVKASGVITSFAIGGQEFWLDDVCVHPEPEKEPGDLPPGAPDLGDAPDSTNHHGVPNTAYPTVNGRFPTVWEGPAANPSGPLHKNETREGILGNFISREKEADQGPDGDGVNNILNGGADVANQDRYDDGWLNPNVPIADCRSTTLRVRVRKDAAATLEKMVLNVWFDGNRDGDWEDVKRCETAAGAYRAYEWIVQNYVVDMTAIAPGGFLDIAVPTRPVLVASGDDAPNRPPWMRFTLSEQRAPLNPATGLADGRGPQFDDAYKWGETEDVRYRPQHVGQPGTLTLEKVVSTVGPVQPGERFSYTIRLKHSGGAGPMLAEMKDELPEGLSLAGRIQVRATHGDAGPLGYVFGDGSVRWRGALDPDSELEFEIPVAAARCYGAEPKKIRNTVRVQPGAGAVLEAFADVSVQCRTLTIADFDITVEIVEPDEVDVAMDDPSVQGFIFGQSPVFKFTIKNNGDQTGRLALSLNYEEIEWRGLTNVAATDIRRRQYGPVVEVAPNAVEVALMTLSGEVWHGCLDCPTAAGTADVLQTGPYPDDEQDLEIEAEACLVGPGEGHCLATAGADQVYRTVLKIRWFTQDLGDAPDSTNHFGAAMNAFAGVPAKYPTVFDPTTDPGGPQGPRHFHPRPFHLGLLVSWEGEADLGPDADVVNNLRPPADLANLDRFDDGARPPLWNLQHCQRTQAPVRVFISPALWNYFSQTQQKGFLNIWLDANRDGDWADGVDCPDATADPKYALEHVVIDSPVDVIGLGPGLHTIVVTTGRVPWPADTAQRPTWVRVTLSEKESNKPLTFAASDGTTVNHGDGRGYDKPFRFGETEDYRWRPANDPVGVDVAVRKRGKLFWTVDESGQPVERIAWSIEYRNLGDADATEDVLLRDRLEDGQNIIGILIGLLKSDSVTRLPDEDNGTTLVFNLGKLAAGEHGRILIVTEVVDDVDVLRNKATIRAEGDVDETNNEVIAEVQLGLRPPRILSPVDGATCEETITVTGHSPRNATVEVYVNDELKTTTTADGSGRWSVDLEMTDGTSNTLWAVAKKGGKTSDPSETVEVKVDSTLLWSPISLKFTDADGHVYRPVDDDGFLGPDGWTIRLRPNTTYTVGVRICCTDENVSATLVISDDLPLGLNDSDGDDTFEGVFTTGPADPAGTEIVLTVVCGNATSEGKGTLIIGRVGPFPPSVDKPAKWRIELTDQGFVPPLLNVNPGDVIEFVNTDVDEHGVYFESNGDSAVSVAATSQTWESGTLLPGDSYKIEVSGLGTFTFGDDQNVANQGALLVEEEQEESTMLLLPQVVR